jgi:hypothetical protein
MNLIKLGALYHDYSIFGVENIQLEGVFALNQQSKMPIISSYLNYAIAKSKNKINDEVSCAELFCADGFYAMLSKHLGATKAIGIDNNREGHFEKAFEISEILGISDVDFLLKDVNEIDNLEKVDVVLNIGGLYHVNNPVEILLKSYNMAKKFLIIQNVVTLKNNNKYYYECPAPGWTWGNRFSNESFDNIIKGLGFNIIDQHFNELEGNDRLEDRGSVYYLIKKEEEFS